MNDLLNCIKTFYNNGNIKSITYKDNNGHLHNPYGPAVISFYINGNKEYECYYLNDVLHSIDIPAFIKFDNRGCKIHEVYMVNGKRHNENGPAEIMYNSLGKDYLKRYFVNNEIIYK